MLKKIKVLFPSVEMPQKRIKMWRKLNCRASREWAGDFYLPILLSFLTMCKSGSLLLQRGGEISGLATHPCTVSWASRGGACWEENPSLNVLCCSLPWVRASRPLSWLCSSFAMVENVPESLEVQPALLSFLLALAYHTLPFGCMLWRKGSCVLSS